MIPFLSYSERRDLREKLYKAYLERCNRGDSTDNKQIVNEIAKLRLEKARLMGYPSYGAFALDDEMAQTPENAYALLDKLWQPSLELAKKELEEMKAIKKPKPATTASNRGTGGIMRKKYASKNTTSTRRCFAPTSRSTMSCRVFSNSATASGALPSRPVSVPVYHKECIAYEVLDKDNKHLGTSISISPAPGQAGRRMVRRLPRRAL